MFNLLLNNELHTNTSTLTEATAIDSKYINSLNFNKSYLISVYSYYLYSSKIRLSILTNSAKNSWNNFISIEGIFKNANWLEREISEMYGIFFEFKIDVRKLLLDYSKLENPLLKDFSSEGIVDVFYNFFENQVVFYKNDIIEL